MRTRRYAGNVSRASMAGLRPPPFFVGDDLALDFLNSVAAPWGEQIEWLASGGDLIAWLEQAHVAPASSLAGSQFQRKPFGQPSTRNPSMSFLIWPQRLR